MACQDRDSRIKAAELVLNDDNLRIRFDTGIDLLEIIDALATYLERGEIPQRPATLSRAEAAE